MRYGIKKEKIKEKRKKQLRRDRERGDGSSCMIKKGRRKEKEGTEREK